MNPAKRKWDGHFKLIGLALLLFIGAATSLTISCVVELNRSNAVTESDLKLWAPELADIYSHQDWLRLAKLGKSFADSPVGSMSFKANGKTVYSYPQESDESQCGSSGTHRITQYGVTLGSLDVCYDPNSLVKAAAFSPFFIATSFSLFFILGFVAIFPVLATRRGFATLVDYLSRISSQSESDASTNSVENSKGLSVEEKLQLLVNNLVTQKIDLERKAIKNEIIRDVAHNMNSPIASLAIRVQQLEGISADARKTLQDSVGHLSAIVAKLKQDTAMVSTPKPASSEFPSGRSRTITMLSPLLEAVVSDKRLEKSHHSKARLEFVSTPSSYGAFASVNSVEFKEVLSNLLNNAFEAVEDGSEISLSLEVGEKEIKIIVSDSGSGIPAEHIPNLFVEGYTFGKVNGSGRGLYHARKIIRNLGGEVTVESVFGLGTKILISLPSAEAPSWFLNKIDLNETERFIVLDDDPSICLLWETRLKHRRVDCFNKTSDFSEWLAQNRELLSEDSKALFLIDLRLGPESPLGLNVIEKEGLAERAVLVTSDAAEESVRKRCSFLGAKLVWKHEIGCLPIAPVDKVKNRSVGFTKKNEPLTEDTQVELL